VSIHWRGIRDKNFSKSILDKNEPSLERKSLRLYHVTNTRNYCVPVQCVHLKQFKNDSRHTCQHDLGYCSLILNVHFCTHKNTRHFIPLHVLQESFSQDPRDLYSTCRLHRIQEVFTFRLHKTQKICTCRLHNNRRSVHVIFTGSVCICCLHRIQKSAHVVLTGSKRSGGATRHGSMPNGGARRNSSLSEW
jgi:hypothetical protein